jgi:RimJ/RimL family protein N-acetyltransferase
MIKIETNRLLIKPYIKADATLMALLHSNPEVMAFMKDRKPLSAVEAAATFARYQECWEIDGFGIFSVRIKETDTFYRRGGVLASTGQARCINAVFA